MLDSSPHARRRVRARGLGRALALAALLVAAEAAAAPPGWLSQHAIFEVTGGPAWRVSLAQDAKAPGFQAATVGAELVVGLDIAASIGVVLEGRARVGGLTGGDYLEGTAGLGVQYRPVERLRARLLGEAGPAVGSQGPAASSASGPSVWLAGAALAVSLDVVPLGAHGALSLVLRIDAAANVDPPPGFPAASLGFGGGFGGRY